MPTKQLTEVQIRWMIRRDMPQVLEIENASFPIPWTEEEFIDCLSQRNCIGMVAERHERIAGFMIYELQKSKLHVLNFAVHPEFRRQGLFHGLRAQFPFSVADARALQCHAASKSRRSCWTSCGRNGSNE